MLLVTSIIASLLTMILIQLSFAIIIGRLIHAKGINTPPPDFSKRVLGMKFTFFTLIALVFLNLGWVAYKFAG